MVWQGALIITALLALTACTRENNTSSLLLGGDVFLARAGEPLFETGIDPWGDLTSVSDEFGQSLFAVNLESPLGTMTNKASLPDFSMNLCAPPESVSILENAGIDLAATANNHRDDCLDSNEVFTAEILDEAGIDHVGNQGEVVYKTLPGGTVAFLALDDVSGMDALDLILQRVQQADANSDLVVISIHWGAEYQAGPTQRQHDLAVRLVDAGADIIWGHHPHVLQPMEWMRSTIDGHDALVLYSLGNLLSDQWMLQDTQKTVLVNIEFTKGGIQKVVLIPMRMDLSSRKLIFPRDKQDITWWVDRLNLTNIGNEKVEIEIWQAEKP